MRMFSAATLALSVSACAFGQSYTIRTFAGGALPENIPATSAILQWPSSVAVDGAGNLFIAVENYAVLRVDATSRLVTLAAGNGTPGYSGDGGPATGAQLGAGGIAVDSAGNLYIADGSLVRRVSNGVIATVAGNGGLGDSGDGGPATGAQLGYVSAVAVDSAGNLYIADWRNDCIRKVSNGVITTVAGNGTQGYSGDNGPATSAQLNYPNAVAVDSAGNLYIADADNYRIRKVSGGVIATVAGNGTGGFSGDNGPATGAELGYPAGLAVDAAGGLYIADEGNARIRKVSNGVITTVAGNGSGVYGGDGGPAAGAALWTPEGIALDAVGNLYIADGANNRIRRVSNGVIDTVAGDGTSGYTGDNGAATGAQLYQPLGVAVDSAGNVYIADTQDQRIRKVSEGVIVTVAGNGTWGYSGDSGPATGAELGDPSAVAVDSVGNMYIADFNNSRIRKVSNGVIATVAGNGAASFGGDNGPAASAQLWGPEGVAVDATGNLYIADTGNHRVRKVSNGAIATVAGNGTQGYSGDGGPAADAELNFPAAVAVDSGGNLYIADSGNGRIRRVANGVIATVAGGGSAFGDGGLATAAELDLPMGVAVDSAGNLYIGDFGNGAVRKVSNGVISTISGGGVPDFSPQGVAVDAAGNVYVADPVNDRVRILIPSCALPTPAPIGRLADGMRPASSCRSSSEPNPAPAR
jgi:sugar lactone lactonase YvrE